MKLGTLIAILTLVLYTQGLAQGKSMNVFKSGLLEELHTEYNIESLPESFYQCAYEYYLNAGEENNSFDIGYLASRECLLDKIDQIRFTDGGLKFLKEFKDASVVGCTSANEEYTEAIHVGRFCTCLYDEYVKYEIGFEMLTDPDFMNTIISEKIATYCFTLHQKEN